MTGVSVTDARKRKEQKKDNVVLTSERHEIDNFDFLYNDTEYDAPKVSFTENLMDEAFSHIGTRYRHGAKGPSAFDCSGFTGYVFRQQVMESLAEDHDTLRLRDLRRDIVIVPNTKPVFAMWEDLLMKKEQIALVVDEYGGMDGIVTMEDIIETLLGFEILDEKDTVADMQQYARERWQQRQSKYKFIMHNA